MIYLLTVLFLIFLGVVCMAFTSDEDEVNIEFLNNYGWEVTGDCIERVKVDIPTVFDGVYDDYNSLQRLARLDITDYKGKKAIRYTYIVTNFPNNSEEKEIRANVLTVKGKPVAGDIMTVSFDGFMYSLNYLNIGK